MSLLLCVFPALAGDLGYAGTAVLPDARHRDPGEVEVAAGGGGLFVAATVVEGSGEDEVSRTIFEPYVLPAARVAWTPAADLRVEADVGYLGTYGPTALGLLSWSFPVGKVVRLGVWGGAMGVFESDFALNNVLFAGGLAMSAQWSKVGLDLDVPVYSAGLKGGALGVFSVLGTEAEVTYALGKGHALRAGFTSALPGLGWQWTGSPWMARAEIHTLGLVSLVRAEVGAAF